MIERRKLRTQYGLLIFCSPMPRKSLVAIFLYASRPAASVNVEKTLDRVLECKHGIEFGLVHVGEADLGVCRTPLGSRVVEQVIQQFQPTREIENQFDTLIDGRVVSNLRKHWYSRSKIHKPPLWYFTVITL
jgi:hypothetical protein